MKNSAKTRKAVVVLSLFLASCKASPLPMIDTPATPKVDASRPTSASIVTSSSITPLATSTFYPVLDAQSASQFALQLLSENTTCQLPCWWRMTPSLTTLQDARSFLHSFSSLASTNSHSDNDGSTRLRIPNGEGLIYLIMDYEGKEGIIETMIVGISQLVENDNNQYEQDFGNPAFMRAVKLLTPAEVLTSYGPPNAVLISTYSLQPLGSEVYFDTQLFYPEHGFMIVYQSLMEFSEPGHLRGCPSESNIVIGLWEPGQYSSIAQLPHDLRANISGFPLSSYIALDEATSMNVQEFYDSFKDDDGPLCIETPVSLWPRPGQ